MHQVTCNKCKATRPSEGDSWCLGCSSLEVSQQILRKKWTNPGLRTIAEESALGCARYLRALYNLDGTLVSSAGAGSRSLQTCAKSRAEPRRSRSPRDERSPLRRSTVPKRSEPLELKSAPARRVEEEESDYEYDEESEEERDHQGHRVKEEDAPIRDRGSERPPEPPHPPKQGHHHRSSKRGKRRGRKRGGSKHQKHHREEHDPFRRSHRRLDSSRLELARGLEDGLSRRA